MQKPIEGTLEIQVSKAEFLKKSSSFKIYFEFIIGNKSKKSEAISSQNPSWKEKCNIGFNNENLLFLKIYEKKTVFKDPVLMDIQLDLIELKQKLRTEHYLSIQPKGKLKGTLSLIMTLHPSILTPKSILNNIEEEILVQSAGDERVYKCKLSNDNRKIFMILNYFKDLNLFQNFQKRLKVISSLKFQGACKLIDIIEKKHEAGVYLIFLIEVSLNCKVLAEDLQIRKSNNQNWSENELIDSLKRFLEIFSIFEKNELYYGEVNPLTLSINPELCLIFPGIYYKLLENPMFNDLTQQEWTFPYYSPLIIENYYNTCRKIPVKPHSWTKSDIFSLGLVFLHMSSLNSPKGLNDSELRLSERLEQEINSIPYSDHLKGILRQMLKVEEPERVSFATLSACLNGP